MSSAMKRLASCAAVAFAAMVATSANAKEPRKRAVPPPPQYVQECGSCHVPYAPRLLPEASWRALMGGLARHFDSDASLDDASAKAIGAWLEANAATGKRAASPAPDHRITRSSWFLREHGGIAPAVWRRASVKGPSNCAACHAGAEQGVFNEHDVRIPR